MIVWKKSQMLLTTEVSIPSFEMKLYIFEPSFNQLLLMFLKRIILKGKKKPKFNFVIEKLIYEKSRFLTFLFTMSTRKEIR